MLQVERNRLVNARVVIGSKWPWIAQSDRRMLPLRSMDPETKVIRMRHPPPVAVLMIRASVRFWKINWPHRTG